MPGSDRRQAERACTPSPAVEADSCAAVTRCDREVNGNRSVSVILASWTWELPMRQSGRMGSKRRLPHGWSYPLKPGEIAAALPGVSPVTWNGRPQGWRTSVARPVFWLRWNPRSAMPQPVLTV
jgi:hypothetical protein